MMVPLITSTLLPIPHGFSTRLGGMSEGPYQSLNLSFAVGDNTEHVTENFLRLGRTAEVAPTKLFSLLQLHGDRVLKAPEEAEGIALGRPCGEADALWTDRSGSAVAVRVADCVPILLADEKGHRIAAVHSGWRGAMVRVAGRAVEALVEQGSEPRQMIAAIGPSIRQCCYAVSPSLAAQFSREFGADVITLRGNETHLNLALTVRRTLEQAGVPASQIDVLPHCTACDPQKFFSHRRDRGVTGRHLCFAVCRF